MRLESTGRCEVTHVGGETIRSFIPFPLPPQPPLEFRVKRQRPFEEKMTRLTAELRKQMEEGAKLDKLIWANLEDIGYGG